MDQISEIVSHNDAALGNLEDSGSQGGFIIYLVGEENVSLQEMWE